MKKIIKFLPAMAILLASGLAVATTSKVSTPNVKWNATNNQWEAFSGPYICLPAETPCVAHRAPNGTISDVTQGAFTQ